MTVADAITIDVGQYVWMNHSIISLETARSSSRMSKGPLWEYPGLQRSAGRKM